ncbi:hypothetical protein [Catellicoccus marimammalium]|uniref:Lipoprotein n=1 Tax=Catellicoccus marimammalium M35/04/3 TaxID=1234409 RepID=K8Z860_9ENTE|nr:hypothetical protein [Catellicoccus marimammalium]EKU27209.1 hypothetical protein C683_0866 [Catellicoccus marimammalium M35/04/3]
MKVNKWLVVGILGLTGLGLLTGCGDKKETASTPSSSEVQQKTPTAEEPFIEGVPMDYYVDEEVKKPRIYFVPTKDHKVEIYDVSYEDEETGKEDYKKNEPKFIYATTLPYKVEKTDRKGVYQIIMQANEEELEKLPEMMDSNCNSKDQIIYDVTEKDGQLYVGDEWTASYNVDKDKPEYKKENLTKDDLLGKNERGAVYLSPSSYTDK